MFSRENLVKLDTCPLPDGKAPQVMKDLYVTLEKTLSQKFGESDLKEASAYVNEAFTTNESDTDLLFVVNICIDSFEVDPGKDYYDRLNLRQLNQNQQIVSKIIEKMISGELIPIDHHVEKFSVSSYEIDTKIWPFNDNHGVIMNCEIILEIKGKLIN